MSRTTHSVSVSESSLPSAQPPLLSCGVRRQEARPGDEYPSAGIRRRIADEVELGMKPEAVLRWAARAWGVASTLLVVAFLFGGREHVRPTANEALGLLFFPIGVIAGF